MPRLFVSLAVCGVLGALLSPRGWLVMGLTSLLLLLWLFLWRRERVRASRLVARDEPIVRFDSSGDRLLH